MRYFEGCPKWRIAYARLTTALRQAGLSYVEPVLERVESPEDAERLHFVGSPTIIVNGGDPFDPSATSFGLRCRVYETPDGPSGSPTTDQLRDALLAAI